MKKASAGNNGFPCGLLLVDKPRGLSSHDVVDRVRRHTGVGKAGHGGTLDPFATGLLLVLLGRATRLFDYFLPLAKEYRATVRFGFRSTTGDSEGDISAAAGRVSEAELRQALDGFRGAIRQRVPEWSAVKVGGERLYRRARRGEAVDTPVREVTVHRLELASFDGANQEAVLEIACSKGTYIRRLCEDIAAAAGSAAYCSELRRTAIGEFRVENAVGLERLEAEGKLLAGPGGGPSFISCFGALYFLPVREIAEKEKKLVLNGRPLEGEAAGPTRIASCEQLLAVYGPGREAGRIDPLVVFS